MNKVTLVTGATGYLGAKLVEALVRRGDGPVRAMVRNIKAPPSTQERRASRAEELRALGVELVQGDLAHPDTLPDAVRGASRVFHAGAFVTRWTRNPELFGKTNVEGTQHLLEAALKEGVQDFVYTSSFIALGPSRGAVADESSVHPGPFRNEYERTKKLALDVARQYVGKGLGLKIVFPGVIFGPGAMTEGNLVAGIIRDYCKRQFPLLGDGKGRWCYSFVDDVVEGHVLASERGRDGGQYFLGGENLSMVEMLKILERLTGIRPLPLRVPFWMGSAVGWLNEKAAWLGAPVKLTRGEVQIFKEDWAFSSARAQAELGYAPTPFEQALAATVDWVRQTHR